MADSMTEPVSGNYSGLADASTWVLPDVLKEQSKRNPDKVWIVTTSGENLTFGEAYAAMLRGAGHFAAAGIKPGDRVLVMMRNGCEFIRVWLSITALGATAVLINNGLTGPFLQHQVKNASATLFVVDSSLMSVVNDIQSEDFSLPQLMVVNQMESGVYPAALRWEDYQAADPFDGTLPRAHDIACIMYTSGTDGPSKAVIMPHAHCTLFGVGMIETAKLGENDRFYIVLPLFHANALLISLGATLLAGITAIIRPKFSASAWIDDIRTYRATVTSCLGALAAFVTAQPPRQDDREHSLRLILNAPNPKTIDSAFRDRFGVRDVVSAYGMTEVNLCVWGRMGHCLPGAAGWPDDRRFEVIVADPETDQELPRGTFGEILVRPKVPFGFMAGYHGIPEKTVSAWRNLWFHTGDGGVMARDGALTFVDRIRDCIRRRGENISVTEIEAAVAKIPQFSEVVAYAVPSDLAGGEDEIMLAVTLHQGTQPAVEELVFAIKQLLPRFMQPRYLRILESLPKTSTGKVQRAVLKKEGLRDAFDIASLLENAGSKTMQAMNNLRIG